MSNPRYLEIPFRLTQHELAIIHYSLTLMACDERNKMSCKDQIFNIQNYLRHKIDEWQDGQLIDYLGFEEGGNTNEV